ncbi:MAG: DUF4382 domain-containing protein [Bacteroidales bacterium]|nr:DUF4382 domain-containing protein [Bacteroidales bacterium]
MIKLKTLTVMVIAFSLLILGCNNKDEATGTLSIKLTDAPFPTDLVQEANVTIFKVEARQSGSHEGSPYVTLSEEEFSFNLLDLTNGITANLVNIEVPAGSYNLFRLYISKASVVLKDGKTYDLTVPSGASSGLKIFVKPEIVVAGGLTAELVLDFDVSQSFIPQGDISSPDNVTGFIFKPVIKATNVSVAGSLVGTVTNLIPEPIEGAQISVFAADTLNTTTFTDELGGYAVLGLEAGSYKVMVESEGYVSHTVEVVEIIVANATTQNFELEEEQQ